jgi:hypothetical protein
LKQLSMIFGIVLFLGVPTRSTACSLISCSPNAGDETRSDFLVKVTLEGRPLANVDTWVTRSPGDENKLFSGVTGSDGTVRIQNLPPGEYWLVSQRFGISAGGICFHINSRPSRSAKQLATFHWGEEAASTRRVAGKLIDPAPGEGAVFLQNIIARHVEPIPEAKFKLQDPITGANYSAVSGDDGRFSFGDIPNGTYVLHVEGGETPAGHELQPTDLLIRVTDTASRDMLLLERSGGSTCGGPYLILEWPYKAL